MRELFGVAPNHGIWTSWTIYSQGLESESGLKCQEALPGEIPAKDQLKQIVKRKKKSMFFSGSNEIAWGC